MFLYGWTKLQTTWQFSLRSRLVRHLCVCGEDVVHTRRVNTCYTDYTKKLYNVILIHYIWRRRAVSFRRPNRRRDLKTVYNSKCQAGSWVRSTLDYVCVTNKPLQSWAVFVRAPRSVAVFKSTQGYHTMEENKHGFDPTELNKRCVKNQDNKWISFILSFF